MMVKVKGNILTAKARRCNLRLVKLAAPAAASAASQKPSLSRTLETPYHSHNAPSTAVAPAKRRRRRRERQRQQHHQLGAPLNIVQCCSNILLVPLLVVGCLTSVAAVAAAAASTDDDISSLIGASSRFPFDLLTSSANDFASPLASPSASANNSRSTAPGSPFVWQPLPLRATFRPLNRQAAGRSQSSSSSSSFVEPSPLPAPPAPRQPRPPRPLPSAPESLTLSGISERSIGPNTDSPPGDNFFPPANRFSNSNSNNNNNNGADSSSIFASPNSGASSAGPFSSNFFQPPPQPAFESATDATIVTTTTTTTPPPPPPTPTRASFDNSGENDDELPTRLPMSRFRPTRAPSDDEDSNNNNNNGNSGNGAEINSIGNSSSSSSFSGSSASSINGNRISGECFECMCEASTNCNVNSRCQTSDVRHTRCGMFLISYDQWLATGLSRELVTREALARDAAADERAFYECVTSRQCAERLLSIYLLRNQKDCDKDGRVDCYDMAAIHHSGLDQCAGEALLDSQYWNDFNACLGFGR